MTGSVTLDVIIALVFIYLIYSLLATILQEIIASNIMRLRAGVLEEGIKRMLDDDNEQDGAIKHLLSTKFYSMPLIKYLGQDKNKKPSYLAASNFSKTLLDILIGPGAEPGDDFGIKINDTLSNGIPVSEDDKIQKGDTYNFLKSLWADAHGDVDKFRIMLEKWFNDGMDRATGWYKRKTQAILFFISLLIAIFFNLDTIDIVHKLSTNPELTAKIVQQADNFIKAHPDLENELRQQKEILQRELGTSDSIPEVQAAEKKYQKLKVYQDSLLARADSLLKNEIKSLNGVLGTGIQNYKWRGTDCVENVGYVLLSVVGWLITALALSLGAPFWFDLLNKLMKLRSSVPVAPDDKSKVADQSSLQNTIVIKG